MYSKLYTISGVGQETVAGYPRVPPRSGFSIADVEIAPRPSRLASLNGQRKLEFTVL